MGENLFLKFDGRRSRVFYPKFLGKGRLYVPYVPLWTAVGVGATQFYIFLLFPPNFYLYWLIFQDSIYPDLNILNSYFYTIAMAAKGLDTVVEYFTAHYINAVFLTLTFPLTLFDFLIRPEEYTMDFLLEKKYKALEV